MFRRQLPFYLLLVSVACLYLSTLAPSLNWADGARMQLDAMFGGSTYWSFEEARQVPTDGLPFDRLGAAAWDHPLYVMLARWFISLPIAEPLYRINLMSAVFGVLAIAMVYMINMLLVKQPWISLLGALALAVSHTFWFHSVTSEAYSLYVLFMACIIFLALRWPLYQKRSDLGWFALLAGLGLANHIMLALTIAPLGIYILIMTPGLRQRQPGIRALLSPGQYVDFVLKLGFRSTLVLVGLFIIGLAPWWIQFLRMARIIGVPLMLQIAAGFPWLGHRLEASSPWTALLNLVGYSGWLILQFTLIGLLVGVYGFWKMTRSKPDVGWLFLLLLAIQVAFSANYNLADQFNFHLPSYLIFSLGITWGIAEIWGSLQRYKIFNEARWRVGVFTLALVAVLTPIGLYATMPSILRDLGYTEARLKIPPIGLGARDAFKYFLNPNKHGDDSAAHFARSTLALLAPHALIFTPKPSDQETYVVLRYVQLIEGVRPDIHLELMLFDPLDDIRQGILEIALIQATCRPVYLASLDPKVYPIESLHRYFEIVPEANLYRLLPINVQPPPAACPTPSERWADIRFDQMIHLAMRWR